MFPSQVYPGQVVHLIGGPQEYLGEIIDHPMNIGSWEGQNRFYKGLADEIAIFSVALSVDEINDIIVNGLAGVSPVSPAGRLVSTWSHIKSQ